MVVVVVWCGYCTDNNTTLRLHSVTLGNQNLPGVVVVVWWCCFLTDYNTTIWLHWVTLGYGNLVLI